MAKKKILLVEDEVKMARMYKDMFESSGYEVIMAFEAEEGVEKAHEEKPDLILLDVLLPRADGIELLRKVREDKELKDTPVVALSNYDAAETKKKAFELGVLAYLMKSDYTPKSLIEKIESYISKS